MIRGLRLSVGLFSILPVRVGTPDAGAIRWAIRFAPLVGLVIGLLAAGLVYLTRWVAIERFGPGPTPGLVSLLAATLGVLGVEVLSGGMHMDGFADSIDGLASRGDRDRTLEVMRDSAVGAVGALAITLLVAVDVVALAVDVLKGVGTETLVTAVVAGRVAIVWGCTRPAARPEGLGAWVSRAVTWRSAAVVTLICLLVPASLILRDDDPVGTVIPVGLVAIPVAVAVALAAVTPLVRRVGGITGDVLGALAEIATATVLVLMAVFA